MGSFMLDGHCEVISCKDLVEKEGPKIEKNDNNNESQSQPSFMKIKLAKFVIFKRYQNISLKTIVEHKRKMILK